MSALDDARQCLASPLTIYGKDEYRRIIEGLVKHIEMVTPWPGHCILNIPRDSDEKPSPCAMAGFCLQAHGNDRRKGGASKSLWDRRERRRQKKLNMIDVFNGDALPPSPGQFIENTTTKDPEHG